MTDFDAATWLGDFRAIGGDVTIRIGGMWIETADVALQLEGFTSVLSAIRNAVLRSRLSS